MDEHAAGVPDNPPNPRPADLLEAFPGRVAVADEAMGRGPIASLQADGVNGHPWGIDAIYCDHKNHRMITIRTVRSAAGMNPRGLPAENADIQIVNFFAPAQNPNSDLPEPPDFNTIRSAVQQAEAYPVEVTIDAAGHTATRTDVLSLSVVEMRWEDRRVFATGQPSLCDALSLRSASVADLMHL